MFEAWDTARGGPLSSSIGMLDATGTYENGFSGVKEHPTSHTALTEATRLTFGGVLVRADTNAFVLRPIVCLQPPFLPIPLGRHRMEVHLHSFC